MTKRMLVMVAVITVFFVIALFAGSEKDTKTGVRSQNFGMSQNSIPLITNFQGVLTNGMGSPLDTMVEMIFSVYDAESGGVPLYSEPHTVAVRGGIFNVPLEIINSLEELDRGKITGGADEKGIIIVYLGLKVGDDQEMTPRQLIGSVPFAYKVHGLSANSEGSIVIDNKIGIGTADPQASLHIEGSGAEAGIVIDNHDGIGLHVLNDGGDGFIIEDNKVGIGTADPQASLHIEGSGAEAGIVIDNHDGIGLHVLNDSGDGFIIEDNKVGIGTADPQASLHVEGSGAEAGIVIDNHDGIGFQVLNDSGDGFIIEDNKVGIGMTDPQAALHINGGANEKAIIVQSNGGAGFIIEDNKVGIGTASPAEALDVEGNVLTSGTIACGNSITLDGTNDKITATSGTINFDNEYLVTSGRIGVGTTSPEGGVDVRQSSGYGTLFQGQSGTVKTHLLYTSGDNHGRMVIRDAANRDVIVFRTDGDCYFNIPGDFGIGQTSPSHPLHMGSGAHCTSGGVWTNASSRKHKENVTDLPTDEALKALENLIPVTFNYKADKEEQYVGFIAEDVPELVATKDREGLSPMDVIGVLTKVVQEQQRLLDEQQQRISQLEQDMKEMR